MLNTKTIIGWREYIDLPEWGIRGLRAKIDTGARSSALHVEDIKMLTKNRIRFYVVLNKKDARKKVIATRVRKGRVKSSIGVKTERWYVQTTLRLGGIEKKVLVNLVGREGMNFRMLVGRHTIKDDFIVDVNKSFHLTPLKKRKLLKRKK